MNFAILAATVFAELLVLVVYQKIEVERMKRARI